MNTEIAIQVENLSKVYPLRQPKTDKNGGITNEHWALKGVSFEVKKGESIGIIGPNGSGKSTLLKILAGVTKPTSGKVSIRGKVASILDIGAGFHPELSGRENVFLNGQIHGFSKKEIELKFDEIVAFSGIEQFIDEPVKNYSNGMYLRLAFSIMTHMEFDVYLLDEVLSVGDEEFQNKCIERINKIVLMNKTVIAVYHNLVFADKVVNKEIDIRTIQETQTGAINNDIKNLIFDDQQQLQYGGNQSVKLKLRKENILKPLVEAIVTIVSSTGVTLAVSNTLFIDFNHQNNCVIDLNINLAKGVYLIKVFDTSDSYFIPMHTCKITILANQNSLLEEHSNKLLQSVTLFNIEA